jgi:hypothetical protein
MARIISFLFIAAFFLMLNSCFEAECVNWPEAKTKAVFYSYDTKKAATPNGLTLHGVEHPDTLYYKGVASVLLPLKPTDNKTEFVIEINGTADTIRFIHSNSFHLVSRECGYAIYHSIDSIYFTMNAIDSISLINKEITPQNIEHVAIFF